MVLVIGRDPDADTSLGPILGLVDSSRSLGVRSDVPTLASVRKHQVVPCFDCNRQDDPIQRLDYGGFFDEAEQREKAGRLQVQCDSCGRWVWKRSGYIP